MVQTRNVSNGCKRLLAAVAAGLSVAAWAAPAGAQTAQPEVSPGQPQPISPSVQKPANTLNIHGSFTGTYTTDYVTRGVLLENQGAIFQPTAEFDLTVFENKLNTNFGKGVLIAGIWNSIHSNHEFAGGASGQATATLSSWYEFDWYVGASIDVTPELNLNVLYQEFLSPSDAFGTCKNVQAKVSYNDSKYWEKTGPWNGFALSPYVIGFFELDGKAGTGSDEGVYVEVGISPSYTINPDSSLPIKISVPITAGFGFGHFYGSGLNADGSFAGTKDENYGFVSVGLLASIPLNFMSDAGLGAWTYSVGGYYYNFGNGVQDFNDAGAGGGSRSEWVAITGVSVSF